MSPHPMRRPPNDKFPNLLRGNHQKMVLFLNVWNVLLQTVATTNFRRKGRQSFARKPDHLIGKFEGNS